MSQARYDLAAALDDLHAAGGSAATVVDALDAYLNDRDREHKVAGRPVVIAEPGPTCKCVAPWLGGHNADCTLLADLQAAAKHEPRESGREPVAALDAYLDERERKASLARADLGKVVTPEASGHGRTLDACGAVWDPTIRLEGSPQASPTAAWREAWHEGPGGKAIRCTTAVCVHPNHRRLRASDAEVRGHDRPAPVPVTCTCKTQWEGFRGDRPPERVIAKQVSGCPLHGVCAKGHALAASGLPGVRCEVCGWAEARHVGSVFCQVHSCGDPAHYTTLSNEDLCSQCGHRRGYHISAQRSDAGADDAGCTGLPDPKPCTCPGFAELAAPKVTISGPTGPMVAALPLQPGVSLHLAPPDDSGCTCRKGWKVHEHGGMAARERIIELQDTLCPRHGSGLDEVALYCQRIGCRGRDGKPMLGYKTAGPGPGSTLCRQHYVEWQAARQAEAQEVEKAPAHAQPQTLSHAHATTPTKAPREVWVVLSADGNPLHATDNEAKARLEAHDWYSEGEHAPVERYVRASADSLEGVPLDDVAALLEYADRYDGAQGRLLVATLAKHLRAGLRVAPDMQGHWTLWCLDCGRDGGYHLDTCSKADRAPEPGGRRGKP